jgi:fibronectin-binding autotransporter adhesin
VTVASGATLGGNGTINGATLANGTIMVGPSVGTLSTLTFSTDLTISNDLVFEVNTALAQSNDVIIVDDALTNSGTGTLTVTNIGPSLVVGDRFALFNQPVPNGNALTIVGPLGVTFTNNLVNDGSITVLTAPITLPAVGTNITFSFTHNTLTLNWPTNYIGWELQSNSIGLTKNSNWFLVPGSTSTNSVIIGIDPTKAVMFFRMHHP